MPKVVLFIATSLDGFIADAEGDINWLFTDSDYGYADFFDGIEALVMGRKTYEQVRGYGDWPYGSKPTYVLSKSAPSGEHPHVEYVSAPVEDLVDDLRARCQQDVWLVGGAGAVTSFRRHDLIDEYVLSIHPVLVGDGVALFESGLPSRELVLESSQLYPSGLVQLRYRKT